MKQNLESIVRQTMGKETTKISEEDINRFEEFTKPIPLSKIPQMPFSSIASYLNEYNLIMKKKSQLTGSQRIHVKNVIHAEVRKGNVKLMLEDNGQNKK